MLKKCFFKSFTTKKLLKVCNLDLSPLRENPYLKKFKVLMHPVLNRHQIYK